MQKRNITVGIGAAMAMGILILDGRTAFYGAQQGIDLCIRTVIPSIFPFLFLSALISDSFQGMMLPGMRTAAKLFGIPNGMEMILIPAFLGGYPVGAQCICREYQKGMLSKRNAERMLAFCSNAGPSFLFGILAGQFSRRSTLLLIWGIQIFAAWVASCCFPMESVVQRSEDPVQQTNVLETALTAIGRICGWIVLFRILVAFLDRWILWMLPDAGKVLLVGTLELSNGCCMLSQITDGGLRFLAANWMLALGGGCVALQTQSVCRGLNIRYYCVGKIIQAFTAAVIAAAMIQKIWIILPGLLLTVVCLRCKAEKKGGISKPAVV